MVYTHNEILSCNQYIKKNFQIRCDGHDKAESIEHRKR
jgi:hypothetical protein